MPRLTAPFAELQWEMCLYEFPGPCWCFPVFRARGGDAAPLFALQRSTKSACWWVGNVYPKSLGWWKGIKPKRGGTSTIWKCDLSTPLLYNRLYWGFFLSEPDLDNTGVITNYCGCFLYCRQWVSHFIHKLDFSPVRPVSLKQSKQLETPSFAVWVRICCA